MNSDKYGTIWSDEELDLIIADYFLMLAKDLAREPYVKSHHSAALMARIGRSHRSVEFKHQNISAVLEQLGLPWIPGYAPKRNYQNAIFDSIDRYLSSDLALLTLTPTPENVILSSETFVSPPPPVAVAARLPMRLERLVRKFDPVERDYRNRALGRAGEKFVVEIETQRLCRANRSDLAKRVRWVADVDGDGAGFDVQSYELDGQDVLIEVKTTNGGPRTPFYLTRTELEISLERQAHWLIYRVHDFAEDPKIFRLPSPLQDSIILEPQTWRAHF